jgi:predicted SprT family Zn-dependent metalloprotease
MERAPVFERFPGERPALGLVRDLLVEMDPALTASFDAPAGSVTVNGIEVPVVRPSWRDIGPFFERLFGVTNQRFFGGHLPGCTLAWNRRFRNLGGRILPKEKLIELSSPHYEACGAAALGIVLIHEQIHLELFECGLDSGHTRWFKAKSQLLGMPSIHHAMPLPSRLIRPRAQHRYRCHGCGKTAVVKRRYSRAVACRACCDRFAGGRFSERYLLRYDGMEIVTASGIIRGDSTGPDSGSA